MHEQIPVGIPLALAMLVNSSSASISPLRIVASCLRSALRIVDTFAPLLFHCICGGAGYEGTILRCDKAGSISQAYHLCFIPSFPLRCRDEDPRRPLVETVLEGMSMGMRSHIA